MKLKPSIHDVAGELGVVAAVVHLPAVGHEKEVVVDVVPTRGGARRTAGGRGIRGPMRVAGCAIRKHLRLVGATSHNDGKSEMSEMSVLKNKLMPMTYHDEPSSVSKPWLAPSACADAVVGGCDS